MSIHEDVLTALASGPMTMLDVVAVLRDRHSENDVRMAMWELIGEHRVRLRRDRQFERSHEPQDENDGRRIQPRMPLSPACPDRADSGCRRRLPPMAHQDPEQQHRMNPQILFATILVCRLAATLISVLIVGLLDGWIGPGE